MYQPIKQTENTITFHLPEINRPDKDWWIVEGGLPTIVRVKGISYVIESQEIVIRCINRQNGKEIHLPPEDLHDSAEDVFTLINRRAREAADKARRQVGGSEDT